MSKEPSTVSITRWDECPLYWLGDTFHLKGYGLFPPQDKPVCLILARDIAMIDIKAHNLDEKKGIRFDCSGCTGRVQLRYAPAGNETNLPEEFAKIVEHLSQLPFFESLGHHRIRDVLTLLKLERHDTGDVIIRKGDPGTNLYIIVSGKVEVTDENHFSLTELGTGEIFGEMSLVSGDPAGATVKVTEPTTLLYLRAEDFKRVLHRFPSLQMYISCLLARRLAHTNILWAEDLTRGMAGDLAEMSPSGLFQTMNLNQKTGVLSLDLPSGKAELCFRNGELLDATMGEAHGIEAFNALLAEPEGRFQFDPALPESHADRKPLGPFMNLLMDGLRELDERNHLKTQ